MHLSQNLTQYVLTSMLLIRGYQCSEKSSRETSSSGAYTSWGRSRASVCSFRNKEVCPWSRLLIVVEFHRPNALVLILF